MKLYEALQNVRWGKRFIKRGSVILLSLSHEKEVKLQSALAEVVIPLDEIPGWERRAPRLVAHGYGDAQTVIVSESEKLAEALGVQPATVDRWKKQLLSYLESLSEMGGG